MSKIWKKVIKNKLVTYACYISQLQLHKSVQWRSAFMHLHLVQPRGDLHWHLISSLQALAASGNVIQTTLMGSLDQPQPSGDGIFGIDF